MEDWQRRLVGEIVEQIDAYRTGSLSVQRLLTNTMGLIDATGLHPPAPDYMAFYHRWLEIDGENDLLTQPWSRPDWASPTKLNAAISELRDWAEAVGLAASD